MAEKIQLEVVTPERRVLAEPVDMVTVPGLGGELGILPGHTPLRSYDFELNLFRRQRGSSPFRSSFSMVRPCRKACSGRSSCLPSTHSRKPLTADAMPRSGSQAGSVAVRRSPGPSRRPPGAPRPVGQPGFSDRLARRLARHTGAAEDDRPHLVTLSLRVEADEGELVGGCVRLVLQVHDERNPLHFADAALLWTESGPEATHGFGDRARTHASIALRAAADAWPVLDRLLELRVPDEITLDAVELADLLETGLPALKARGVDVLWPRSLGRDLTAVTVLRPGSGKQEEPLIDGLFGPDSLFSFTWQLALHGDPLTQDEMDLLAEATGPVVRLRDNWMVVDPAMARRAKKRLVRTAKPAQALAATLTGVVTVEDVEEKVLVGATLGEGARADHLRGHPRAGAGAGGAAGRAARLPAARADLAGRADRPRARRLPGRRHGPGQDDHADRPAPAPAGPRPGRRADAGGLPGLAARQLGARDRAVRARHPGAPLPRHLAATSTGSTDGGFVLTTYGTMRRDAAGAGRGRRGAWSSPTRPSTSRTPSPRPPRRCAGSPPGPASP